jgi:GH25 family lysozyme M1 (1,4-beta-N-acetylmuramidase)
MPEQPFCLVADLGSQNPIDFQKLAAATFNGAKCVAVILRATRSNHEIDDQFLTRFDAATRAGFLVGAYAFNTAEPAQAQVDRFLGLTKRCGAIFRALDYEANVMSLANAIAFLDQVGQATGNRPWIYSGDNIKSQIVHATQAQRDFLALHGLWGCEYGISHWKNVDANQKPLPWPGVTLWQYTGDGIASPTGLPTTLDGLEKGADLSIFQGTRDDLTKIWAGAPIAPPAVAVAAAQPAAPGPTAS